MIVSVHLILWFVQSSYLLCGYRNRQRWVWEYGDVNDEDQSSGDRFPIDDIGEVRCYYSFCVSVVLVVYLFLFWFATQMQTIRFRVQSINYPSIPLEQPLNSKPFAPMVITVSSLFYTAVLFIIRKHYLFQMARSFSHGNLSNYLILLIKVCNYEMTCFTCVQKPNTDYSSVKLLVGWKNKHLFILDLSGNDRPRNCLFSVTTSYSKSISSPVKVQ